MLLLDYPYFMNTRGGGRLNSQQIYIQTETQTKTLKDGERETRRRIHSGAEQPRIGT